MPLFVPPTCRTDVIASRSEFRKSLKITLDGRARIPCAPPGVLSRTRSRAYPAPIRDDRLPGPAAPLRRPSSPACPCAPFALSPSSRSPSSPVRARRRSPPRRCPPTTPSSGRSGIWGWERPPWWNRWPRSSWTPSARGCRAARASGPPTPGSPGPTPRGAWRPGKSSTARGGDGIGGGPTSTFWSLGCGPSMGPCWPGARAPRARWRARSSPFPPSPAPRT